MNIYLYALVIYQIYINLIFNKTYLRSALCSPFVAYTQCVRIVCSFALRIRRVVGRIGGSHVNRLWRKLWNWYYCKIVAVILVAALACLWATNMEFSSNLSFALNVKRNWSMATPGGRCLSLACGKRGNGGAAVGISKFCCVIFRFSLFLLTLSASFQLLPSLSIGFKLHNQQNSVKWPKGNQNIHIYILCICSWALIVILTTCCFCCPHCCHCSCFAVICCQYFAAFGIWLVMLFVLFCFLFSAKNK